MSRYNERDYSGLPPATSYLSITLRKLRAESGHTLQTITKMTGISVSQLSKMEVGTANPSSANLLRLESAYKVTDYRLQRAALDDEIVELEDTLVELKRRRSILNAQRKVKEAGNGTKDNVKGNVGNAGGGNGCCGGREFHLSTCTAVTAVSTDIRAIHGRQYDAERGYGGGTADEE